jgi:clan AA aspartic protease (TIGR02281 family)
MVDGAVGKGTKAAIITWQKANGVPETGTLTGDQIKALIKQALQQRRYWEWATFTAQDQSFSIGVPRRLFKEPVRVNAGETRIDGISPDYSLVVFTAEGSQQEFSRQFAQLTEANWNRTVEFSVQRDDWWVVSGLEGSSAFYIRSELRGQSIAKMMLRLPRDKTQDQGFLVTAIANSFRAGLGSLAPALGNRGCVQVGETVTGTLTLARGTHPNGTPMTAYVLHLPSKTCAIMASMSDGTSHTVPGIENIHLGPSDDAQKQELHRLIGQAITVKLDELFPPLTAWHFGDAVSIKFVVISNGAPVAQELRGRSQAIEVPMVRSGGTYVVPVRINSAITLDFVLDSGASDVSIPSDVFSTLVRTGTITKNDLLGKQTYQLADGSNKESVTFRVRSLQVGSLTLENVKGSVAEANGPLLLGMSFLGRFSSWSVDNDKHVLILR